MIQYEKTFRFYRIQNNKDVNNNKYGLDEDKYWYKKYYHATYIKFTR